MPPDTVQSKVKMLRNCVGTGRVTGGNTGGWFRVITDADFRTSRPRLSVYLLPRLSRLVYCRSCTVCSGAARAAVLAR